MEKKLFLLDGIGVGLSGALRIDRPANLFLKRSQYFGALWFHPNPARILKNQEPTHIAVLLIPMPQHNGTTDFADYKATRQAMPEDLVHALPHVRRMLDAFRIPVLTCEWLRSRRHYRHTGAARRERRIQILHGYAG